MQVSKNFDLNLPDYSDEIDIEKINYNFKKVDNILNMLLSKCGFQRDVEYKVSSVDNVEVSDVSSGNYTNSFHANVCADFTVTSGGVEVYRNEITETAEIYPFGKYGTWGDKTGVDVCICVKYNYVDNQASLVGYGRYEEIDGTQQISDLTPIFLNGNIILFPIGHIDIDAGINHEKVVINGDAQYYSGDNLKPIYVTMGGDS